MFSRLVAPAHLIEHVPRSEIGSEGIGRNAGVLLKQLQRVL